MRIDLTADSTEDAGILKLILALCDHMCHYFFDKYYGSSDIEIFMVVVCIPESQKLRRRFDKKDQILYYDIIIDYKEFRKAKSHEKKQILAEQIIASFDHLDKYKFDIDKATLKSDARKYFTGLGWL